MIIKIINNFIYRNYKTESVLDSNIWFHLKNELNHEKKREERTF